MLVSFNEELKAYACHTILSSNVVSFNEELKAQIAQLQQSLGQQVSFNEELKVSLLDRYRYRSAQGIL